MIRGVYMLLHGEVSMQDQDIDNITAVDGTCSAFLLAGCIALVALIASPFITRVVQYQHEEGQVGSRVETNRA